MHELLARGSCFVKIRSADVRATVFTMATHRGVSLGKGNWFAMNAFQTEITRYRFKTLRRRGQKL